IKFSQIGQKFLQDDGNTIYLLTCRTGRAPDADRYW
ncbi:unnamed protein product, partial [marine sediment metagenome]